MKIKKLNEDLQGVSDKVIVDKINEIIDVLTSNFTTLNKDAVDVDSLATLITCDTLTPRTNECVIDLQSHYDDCVLEPEGLFAKIKCPRCGARYFGVGNSFTTAVYCPTIYKDGKNINPDINQTTTEYHCFECGYDWKE